MKKLMLILLIAGNCYADDYNPYNFIPNFQNQALIQAEVQKNQAISNYLNNQASINSFQAGLMKNPPDYTLPSLDTNLIIKERPSPIFVGPSFGGNNDNKRPW